MHAKMKTADQFMQAVYSLKEALKNGLSEIEKDNDLQIAADHLIRRNLDQINAVNDWYAFKCGNGTRPKTSASTAFNPHEGSDSTNIYYLIKAMKKVMPWDLNKDILLVPTALTLLKIEFTEACFPCSEVFNLRMQLQGFINRCTLPKDHPDWTDEERQYERERYIKDMDNYKDKLTDAYVRVSDYFDRLENPDSEPVKKKVDQIHTTTKKIAKKVGVKNEHTGKGAQLRAKEIWEKSQQDLRVISLSPRGKASIANSFAVFKDELAEIGITSVKKYRNAIKNAQKNIS